MRVLLPVILVLACHSAWGAGWHDYTLEIDRDYTIFRANSLDVSLSTSDRESVVGADEKRGTGPLVGTVFTLLFFYGFFVFPWLLLAGLVLGLLIVWRVVVLHRRQRVVALR